MPLRDYECPEGHVLRDVLVRADGSDEPKTCIAAVLMCVRGGISVWPCALPLHRLFSAPAAFPGADAWRKK